MMIEIANRAIGKDNPVFIIAEMSGNHNQSYDRACRIIDAAKSSGADAVKIQTYTADTITLRCDDSDFQVQHGMLWEGTTLYELYGQAHTPWEWHDGLKAYAESLGLIFFSSPFDYTSVDFLHKLGVPAYKIASPEINDLPLIQYTAKKNKPIILSSGVATLGEMQEAVNTCKEAANENIIMLHCVTAYPTRFEDINLRTIPNMATALGVVPGLSDHSPGMAVALGAVALGAKVVEKHLTLSRKDGGPDSAFSMEPQEFAQMVTEIRNLEIALGTVSYNLSPMQMQSRDHMRSLFACKDIAKGELLSSENVRSIRPSSGLAPKHFNQVTGRTATVAIRKGTPLDWGLFQ